MASPVRPSQPDHGSRLGVERARQVRGLLLIALAVLLFSLWRAGFDRVFTYGWWRIW